MRIKLVTSISLLPLALLMTGCGMGTQDSLSGPLSDAHFGPPVSGTTYGGDVPIVGAKIFMFAANTTGYGQPSISLITNFPSGSYPSMQDTTVGSPTYGDYYVVTNGNGGFYLASGEYSCTNGQQVYLYSVGGNTGAGENDAAGLMGVLGTCNSEAFSLVSTRVNMTEVSTAAAAYAMSGFAVDPVTVSSSSTSLALTDVANAFNNSANMFAISSANGVAALTTTPGTTGAVPNQLINTVANILAACVDTTGTTGSLSSTCNYIFGQEKSSGSTGMTPTDTAALAINIAHNPNNNVHNLYVSIAPTGAPWAPALSSQPNDFTVGIVYSGLGLSNPYGMAIDGSGNVWFANSSSGSVSEISPLGVVNVNSPYTNGDLDGPLGLAIDPSGNAWTADSTDTLYEITPGTSPTITEYTDGGTGDFGGNPTGLAIDGSNNIWIAQQTTKGVEFSSAGAELGTFSGGGLTKYSTALAINASNYVFVDNNATKYSTTAEFNGSRVAITGTAYAPSTSQYGLNSGAAGIAIDNSGNFWQTNYSGTNGGTGSVTELSSTGGAVSGGGYYTGGGVNHPVGLTIDGNSDVFVADNVGNVAEFNSSGIAMTGTVGYAGGTSGTGLGGIQAIAADGSGDVWITNFSSGTVTELIGISTPVVTPLAANFHTPYTTAASLP